MKKLLLTTLIAGALAGSVFAQGLVSLVGQVYYSSVPGATTGAPVPVGDPAQVGTWGQLNVALVYSETASSGLFSATTAASLYGDWVQAAPVTQRIYAPIARLLPTTVTVGATSPEETFVVAWTGTYATWNAAWNGSFLGHPMLFGWSGENGLGSLGWSQDNVQAPAAPVQINTGPGGFNGIVLQPYAIPEPSVFALAGLGAAALLISRRRK